MNKYQEALDDLEFKAIKHENTLAGSEWDKCALEVQSDVAAIQELIDRNKPKKPYTIRKLSEWYCPICHEYVEIDALNTPIEERALFCKKCGQAIDWSDES